jgi:hypothetical protein
MVEILWEYEVKPECVEEFLRHYASGGTWARLFARDAAWRGTALLRSTEQALRYVTRDAWTDLAAYNSFRRRCAAEYAEIDTACRALTTEERLIGIFELE